MRTSRAAWLWGPVAAYMLLIFVFSGMSEPPVPTVGTDKSSHGLAFMGLAVLVARALCGGLPARLTLRAALATIAITTAYGVSDEYHQSFVPGREPDVLDVYADFAGACAGAAACWAWGIISARHHVL